MWWWWWASRCSLCACRLSDVALPPLSPAPAASRPGLYTARHRLTQELVALQVLDRRVLRSRQTRRRLRQEVRVLQLARGHANLLQLHAVAVSQSSVALTFELARGGPVLPKLQSERDASRVAQQATQGLRFLHAHGIVHGQVRPEYLLYSEDEPDARVVLVAFGRAAPWQARTLGGCRLFSKTDSSQWLGDDGHHIHFVPPFLLRRRRRLVATWREAQQIDVWALGVTLYVMLCGCYPFSDGKERDDCVAHVERRVLLQTDLAFPENGALLSRAARDLLRRLLEKNPDAAMSMEDVAAHPWLDEAVAAAGLWSTDKLAQHRLFAARYAEQVAAVAHRSSGSTTSTSNVMETQTQMEAQSAAGEAGALAMRDKARSSPEVFDGGGAFEHDTLEMDTNEEEEEDEEEARPSFVSTHGTQLLLNEEVHHERPSADSFMRLASLEIGAHNTNASNDDEDVVVDRAISSSSPDAEYASVSAAEIGTVGDGSRRNSIDKMLKVLLGQRRFFSFKSLSSSSSNDRS